MKLKGRFVMDLDNQHLAVLNEIIQTLFFLRSCSPKLLLQVKENAHFDYDFKQFSYFFKGPIIFIGTRWIKFSI